MIKTRITSKGQITIPVKLRRKYGITAGTRIIIIDDGDSIVLKPVANQSLKTLQGSLKGKGLLKALMAEKKREREFEDRNFG
jgi:AbrB family looped-hinge helix DNA binding protein